MNPIASQAKLERLIVSRTSLEADLVELLEIGEYVALLAPVRCGRSTLLRQLRSWFQHERPEGLFLILRPDQTPELSRDVFLDDLLRQLRAQLPPSLRTLVLADEDPYLTLKELLQSLPEWVSGPVVVAVDDLGRVDIKHLHCLLWAFRELHSTRADEGWSSPLARLSVVVAGSRRLFELTIGHEDQTLSPFNIAHLYHMPDLTGPEVESLVRRAQQEGLVQLQRDLETLAQLRRHTAGHPALLKGLLGEVIQLGGRLNPEAVMDAAGRMLQHDLTLRTLWERLLSEPGAVFQARRIFQEGHRPPANLELAPEDLRFVFWMGLITDQNGVYAPRCLLIEQFMRARLESLEQNTSAEGTNPLVQPPVQPPNPNQPPAQLNPQNPTRPVRETDPTPRPSQPRFGDALFPEGLLRGFRAGDGVLFVGAGASRAAGYPSWAELCDAMKRRILHTAQTVAEQHQLEQYLTYNDALAAAQLLRERIGAFEYHRFLRETLRRPASLAPVHEALRLLPTKLVITTNYDKLLERTFRTPDGDDPPVLFSAPQLAQLEERQELSILKMHGDIDHPETIVLTADDYRTYFEQRRAVRDYLEHQFSYRTVLFVGFGLKDPNFELIYEEARRTLLERKRPAYALMVGNNPFESLQWQRRGIHIIDLSSYTELAPYLTELSQRITRSSAP